MAIGVAISVAEQDYCDSDGKKGGGDTGAREGLGGGGEVYEG